MWYVMIGVTIFPVFLRLAGGSGDRELNLDPERLRYDPGSGRFPYLLTRDELKDVLVADDTMRLVVSLRKRPLRMSLRLISSQNPILHVKTGSLQESAWLAGIVRQWWRGS